MGEVYKAIAAIQGKLAKTGIAKDGVNSSQNYKFRGIDQVYSALSPLLAEYGLCVLPRMVDLRRDERVSMKPGYNNAPAKESVLFYVTVTAEFDFVAVADGSTHTVRTYGEAMDSGDKATNKAMSAAYKYAAFMAFAIPTEGDNDADETTHEVAPRQKTPRHDPPVAVEHITDKQRRELIALAVPKGLDARTICEKAGVASIKEMPANVFEDAKAWVIRQKPRTAASPAEAPAGEFADLDDSIPY